MNVVFILFALFISVSVVICFYIRKISNLHVQYEKTIDFTIDVTEQKKIESDLIIAKQQAEAAKPDFSDSAAKPENFKRPLNLLLAEDDVINQKLMKAILTNLNWNTQMANNGIEAVELYKTNKFDAIIMDGQMPEMNGFEATKIIREIEKKSGGHIPIIALTAHAMKGDREKFLEAGMDDYMTKPVAGEKNIIEVLRKYISDN